MQPNALEEAELTDTPNEPEPQPDISEPTPTPEPETTALVPTEPDVIEGEVIEIEPPETIDAHTPTKQKPYWLLIPFTILLCFSILAISLVLPILTPSATITIVPVERTITTLAEIQVHGRMLPIFTLSQSTTAPATGQRHQSATQAHGTITLYNGLFVSQTIAAGTILTGADGVQIITDQAASIPAGNPPIYGQVTVPAHAVNAGGSGNIPAYDINESCCATSVLAKNTASFTGGAAAREYLVVTREDIQNAASPLKTTLLKSEQAALGAQIIAGEALTPPLCSENVTSDHRPGDEATNVTVTVSETCEGFAYPAHDVYRNATQLITSQAKQKLGATYALIGDIQINIIHTTITDQARGIATLRVKLDATYVFQLSPGEKEKLSQLLAGKPKQQAFNTLLQFPGIQAASIQLAGNNTALPDDPHHIHIIVMYRSS